MLFENYTALAHRFPSGCQSLYGEQIQAGTGLWLAVDEQSFPSLLFSSQPSDVRSDIELRFIGVQFSRECQITADGCGTMAGTYTIVRLEENDPDLVRVFLRLLEETFCGDNAGPQTNREIGEKILELANLFSQLDNSTKDVVGLWGELLIISLAESPETAARCWCLHKNAKYDFVCDGFALEVKTTLRPSRDHRFSLDQLRPYGELEVYVASIQVVQAHGGKAAFELVDSILANISDAELRKAFLILCLLKGGEDIYKSVLRLQLLSTEAGIAYFSALDIPVPLIETDAPISNVKFDICLDRLPQQDDESRARLVNLTKTIVE
ncbi:MAG: PD-(D/E)XK motif protein [Sneathiella sp.]|nr:PD-(D/E)XK motif protein [Sneathiella sp.]